MTKHRLYQGCKYNREVLKDHKFSSVQSLSHVRLFATPWIAACQASLSITNSQSPPKPMSTESVMPSNHLTSVNLCPTIQPLSSPSPPALNLSQHQGLFKWVSSSHQVTKVLELQLQHQSFQWTPRTGLLQDGLVGSPCSPRDSQESSPTPQFESINSSALGFLYSPTLTSIHDYWKNDIVGIGKVYHKMGLVWITHHVDIAWFACNSEITEIFYYCYVSGNK